MKTLFNKEIKNKKNITFVETSWIGPTFLPKTNTSAELIIWILVLQEQTNCSPPTKITPCYFP